VSLNAPRCDVDVAGGRLAVFEFGSDRGGEGRPDPGRPVVVLAHGITSTSHAWLPVARELAGEHRILAPDLRGRGRSNALPAPYGMAAHAADLLALLDALGIETAVFAGHSNGAYIVARLAADHPERVHAAVLVDGGLPIPGSEDAEPQTFADAFLGPALARLKLTFPTREAYCDWWRSHPAFARGEVADQDLVAYASHDLTGEDPELRSSASEAAVRGDAAELGQVGAAAYAMTVPAWLLCAPRGLQDQPEPMQPLALVRAWADGAPELRRAVLVPDVNHYTITLGAAGARAVADAVRVASIS
jgi:pimeloyl-ACP methyl ester carboxylesterase